jgi:hypothetical protein
MRKKYYSVLIRYIEGKEKGEFGKKIPMVIHCFIGNLPRNMCNLLYIS